MGGYTGRYLRVDLDTGAFDLFQVSEEAHRAVIGGSGLGAWLFRAQAKPDVEPLSPENPLMILAGPLVGTSFPGSSRFAVCAKSPLTGIWGEASVGGNFGPALKKAGYDGILFRGAADRPVCLHVDDGRAELRDAGALWGKDTYQTTRSLKSELGAGFKVFCIGQAGENRVRYAAIVNDGAHFAGRTGMGAVMGSKLLKAVVIRGTGEVAISDPAPFAAARRAVLEACRESTLIRSFRELGTSAGMDLGMMTGDVPIRNWTLGQDLELSAALGGPALKDSYLVRGHPCSFCPIACKRVVAVPEGPYRTAEGPGPEYETACAFGSMLLNRSLPALIKANELCNRYGMDTISCGATIAFAIECRERGLLPRELTGGLDLSWGNMEAVIALLPKIAAREGIGDLLAEGSLRAAARLGDGAKGCTVTVKGLELPFHDPRAYHGMGLAYAYSSRGGCHNQHSVLPVEQGWIALPDLGLHEDYRGQTSEGKAEMVMICENYGLLLNCLCQCHFVNFATPPLELVKAFNAVTGWEYSLRDFLECGERIWHLKRDLINLMGVRDADDTLPERVLTPLEDGGAAGSVPDLQRMKREYKRLRGLSDEGIPSKDTLVRLGLKGGANDVHADDRFQPGMGRRV